MIRTVKCCLMVALLCASTSATNVYISSSLRPAADGKTPNTPIGVFGGLCEMIHRVRANGETVEAVLLECGSYFPDGLGTWDVSNITIGAYGTGERPIVEHSQPLRTLDVPINNLTIEGIEFRHTGAEAKGLLMLSGGTNLTIRDCKISGYLNNITVQGDKGAWNNVLIQDCIILDATSKGGQAQGIYAENCHGITIDNCVFDRCGTTPSTQSHGAYVHALCTGLSVADCVFSRCAATGLQARPGGVVAGNTFIRCPISLSFGYVLGGSAPTPNGVAGEIRDNVIVEGVDIPTAPSPLIRGIGMQVANCKPGVVVERNLIARTASAQMWEAAIQFENRSGTGVAGVAVRNNRIVDWNEVQFNTKAAMPADFIFADNTVHRVRFPKPSLVMKDFVDAAYLKALCAANTMIDPPATVTYPGSAKPFDDWEGLRSGYYDRGWVRMYYQTAYGLYVKPEPEPVVHEMIVEIPENIDTLVLKVIR